MANRKRCAIYTRKSTEEGLEQDFNSLDAQREACAAFILSQAQEGWEPISELYDDGGFSGGSMDRPGLKQLLSDVEAGKVDVIVVYKVDRLTRSLADFAKIVEILDASDASFVSVTQAFNTTNSMGRLTLNVLLSFAQFEREVTGERIRDKIAASKKKGMWMGGPVPIGYDCKDRQLIVNDEEAATVRHIFERYVELESMQALADELAASGHRTKRRVYRSGRVVGGDVFRKGPLSHLLQNRIYVGDVAHKGDVHPGVHQPIVDRALFDRVQDVIAANRHRRKVGTNSHSLSLLTGMLTDPTGRPMSPSYTSKASRKYRYYVSRLQPGEDKSVAVRIPAGEIERVVVEAVMAELSIPDVSNSPDAVRIKATSDQIEDAVGRISSGSATAKRAALLDLNVAARLREDAIELAFHAKGEDCARKVRVDAKLVRRGSDIRLAIGPGSGSATREPDPALLKLIVHAFAARELMVEGKSRPLVEGYSKRHLSRLIRLSYLAPDIVASITAGTHPPELSGRKLLRLANVPLDWAGQRALVGLA